MKRLLLICIIVLLCAPAAWAERNLTSQAKRAMHIINIRNRMIAVQVDGTR